MEKNMEKTLTPVRVKIWCHAFKEHDTVIVAMIDAEGYLWTKSPYCDSYSSLRVNDCCAIVSVKEVQE